MTSKKRYPFNPSYAAPPGWILEDEIKARKMSQDELARRCGRSRKLISEIIAGKAVLEEETALQIEKVLGISANIWIGLDTKYQLRKARDNDAKKEDCIPS